MDREEKRFQLFATALLRNGVTVEMAAREANEAMEAFDKSCPDYIDPEAVENVIQDRVLSLVSLELSCRKEALRWTCGRRPASV